MVDSFSVKAFKAFFSAERQKALEAKKLQETAEREVELAKQHAEERERAMEATLKRMEEANAIQMKEMQHHHEALMKERMAEQARLLKEGFEKQANNLKELIRKGEDQRRADARRNADLLQGMRADRDAAYERSRRQIQQMETRYDNMVTRQRETPQVDHTKAMRKMEAEIEDLREQRREQENIGFWGHIGKAVSNCNVM